MARHREAVCRLCRREGQKLFLKGLRCFTEKCAIEKRNFVPGQHGQSRRVKKLAGLRPAVARKAEGEAHLRAAGAAVPQLRRKIRARAGTHGRKPDRHARAASRQCRLAVGFCQFALPGAADRPSRARPHQREEGQHSFVSGGRRRGNHAQGENAPEHHGARSPQRRAEPERGAWLEIDRENFKARVVALPKRENVQTPPITEQLIVELYSK